MAPPIRNVSEMIRFTLMPMRLAAVWSSATARIAVPILVRFTSAWSTASMPSAAAMTTSDLTDTSTVGDSSKRSLSASMVGYTRLKALRQMLSTSRIRSCRKNEIPMAEISGISRGAPRSGR